jgi:hypothetical protein
MTGASDLPKLGHLLKGNSINSIGPIQKLYQGFLETCPPFLARQGVRRKKSFIHRNARKKKDRRLWHEVKHLLLARSVAPSRAFPSWLCSTITITAPGAATVFRLLQPLFPEMIGAILLLPATDRSACFRGASAVRLWPDTMLYF